MEPKKNDYGSHYTQNKRTVRRRPNYFIAIQINNPEIHKIAKEIQETILDQNKDLSTAMISLPTLHLTMSVLLLDNQDSIDIACAALDMFSQKYQTEFHNKPLLLEVTGLGHFRNSVLFAKVASGKNTEQLEKIADGVEDCLEDCGILPTETGFKPHITLAKLSKDFPKLRNKGIKKIDSSLYQDYLDCYFGQQIVTSLQLCSMTKKKDDSGYYHVDHKVSIGCETDEQTLHDDERFQDMEAEDNKIDAASVLNNQPINDSDKPDVTSGNKLSSDSVDDSATLITSFDIHQLDDSATPITSDIHQVDDSGTPVKLSDIHQVDDSATPVKLSNIHQVDDSATLVKLSDMQQVDDSATPVTSSDFHHVDDSATPLTSSDFHHVDDSATPVTSDFHHVDDSATPVTSSDIHQVDDSATLVKSSDIRQVGDSATPVTSDIHQVDDSATPVTSSDIQQVDDSDVDPQPHPEYSDIIKYSFDDAIERLKYLSQKEKDSGNI